MKAKELRQKTTAELGEELLKLRREQFNLRMAQASGACREAGPVRQGAPQRRAREDGHGRAGPRGRQQG